MDEGRPIFVQIAQQIEDAIIDGALADGDQAPSTNELAAFHRINPATAAKGVSVLVEMGVLVKRRGIGMFVADGARDALIARRRATFAEQFIVPLIAEADALGIEADDLTNLIRETRRTGTAPSDHPSEGTAP